MVSLAHACTNTASPSPYWQSLTDQTRTALIVNALRSRTGDSTDLAVAAAKSDGQVIVRLLHPMPSSARGPLLLDLEEFIREAVDPGLVLWLEPLGDRNSLRNFRGIEVKA